MTVTVGQLSCIAVRQIAKANRVGACCINIYAPKTSAGECETQFRVEITTDIEAAEQRIEAAAMQKRSSLMIDKAAKGWRIRCVRIFAANGKPVFSDWTLT